MKADSLIVNQPPIRPASLQQRLAEGLEPRMPVVMYQRWRDLLFLHWAVDPVLVQRTLPPGLQVDCYENRAWIGVVPFHMQGVRPRGLPALPGVSAFPELNLRTYVHDRQGRPGVWFYSLDTPKRLANWIARKFFNLNYQPAEMSFHTAPDGGMSYQSKRVGTSEPQSFEWRRIGSPRKAEVGSLEFFLVERYRLFAYDADRRRLHTGRVHHAPYPIQSVELDAYSEALFSINHLPRPGRRPDSILASHGVDVKIYPLSRVDRADRLNSPATSPTCRI